MTDHKTDSAISTPRGEQGAVLLIKASNPGWEKTFSTAEDACAELLDHICADCLAGTRPDGSTGRPPEQSNIRELLGTMCGAEFWFEDSTGEKNEV